MKLKQLKGLARYFKSRHLRTIVEDIVNCGDDEQAARRLLDLDCAFYVLENPSQNAIRGMAKSGSGHVTTVDSDKTAYVAWISPEISMVCIDSVEHGPAAFVGMLEEWVARCSN